MGSGRADFGFQQASPHPACMHLSPGGSVPDGPTPSLRRRNRFAHCCSTSAGCTLWSCHLSG
eukprot:6895474-Prorocentrum_lima.AAC.1